MLTCYHISIYHNRAVPCWVARLLQPCYPARHGFASVNTSNFNRTVPCRAGTEKLCHVNEVLTLFTMGSSSPPAETSLSFGVSPAIVIPLKSLAISCLTSDTEDTSPVIPPTSPFTTEMSLLLDATNTALSGLTGTQGVCCPLQTPFWCFPGPAHRFEIG